MMFINLVPGVSYSLQIGGNRKYSYKLANTDSKLLETAFELKLKLRNAGVSNISVPVVKKGKLTFPVQHVSQL